MLNRPTWAADIKFEPKTYSDHVKAYFDTKLVLGAFAVRNSDLMGEGKGLVVNFPYYNTIGEAEEPEENEKVGIDNLTDDSFNTSVFEVAKGVGFSQKSFLSTADSKAGMIEEGMSQIGRRFAERVEKKLLEEIFTYSGTPTGSPGLTEASYNNMVIGYKAAKATDVMNPRIFLEARELAFGDKADETAVCFMHTLQLLDLMTDTTSGFLKADANSPWNFLGGFQGTLFGTPIIRYDGVPKASAQVANTDAYVAHFHKANAFGIIEKEDVTMTEDFDAAARKYFVVGNQWYGVKSFDRKIHSLDNKSGGIITTVSKSLKRG